MVSTAVFKCYKSVVLTLLRLFIGKKVRGCWFSSGAIMVQGVRLTDDVEMRRVWCCPFSFRPIF